MKNRMNLDRCVLDLAGRGDAKDFLTLRDCFENIFITGSTGSGKSSGSGAMLALSLLNKRGLNQQEKVGLVVFMYKDDVEDWQRWAWQQGREDDILHIRATDANVFNLLECYREQEPINAVNALMNISGLSVSGNRKESEPFWEVQQRTRLDRLIRLNQLSGEPLSILTLYRLHSSTPNDLDQLTDEGFAKQSYCWELMAKAAERVGEDHPDFKLVEDYFFRTMPNLNDRTSSSILAMTASVLEPFVSSRILNRMFCGGTRLKLEDVFSGKILLLDIPIARHEHVGRIAQIMLGYALMKEVEKRDLSKHGNPLIFHYDEFQNFLTPYMHQFMSTCRSSRAGVVVISQNTSNLRAAMGGGYAADAKVNALLGLTNTRFYHANNCTITNEFGANSIGKSFLNLSSVNIGRQNDSSAGTSQALHHLIEPRVFTMLRKGGKANGYLVDSIITGTGRVFSNGLNYLTTTFKQHFAQ